MYESILGGSRSKKEGDGVQTNIYTVTMNKESIQRCLRQIVKKGLGEEN